jgi:glycosyltransferase involved in cell wall biosynthesis
VPIDRWTPFGDAQVKYLSPGQTTPLALARHIRAVEHDVLYINSLFSIGFGVVPLLLRRFGLVPHRSLVLAPRGELSRGALSLNPVRKRAYLCVARALGLMAGATWQSAGEHEMCDVRRTFGPGVDVVEAPDLTAPPPPAPLRPPKEPGRARLVFVGRIVPMKNLLTAVEILREVACPVSLQIVGPAEDEAYWMQCRRALEALPDQVSWTFHGAVPPARVPEILAGAHLLLLPTLGENFGHAIVEALLTGCPVLISDRTRWRNLDREGAGWDLPLDRLPLFRKIIEDVAGLEENGFGRMSRAARDLGVRVATDDGYRQRSLTLFERAAGWSANETLSPPAESA